MEPPLFCSLHELGNMIARLSSQNFDELINTQNINIWEWRLFENIIMMVFRNDVACIGLEGTVNKLVIVGVGSNETQMVIHLNHLCIG